MFRFKTIPPDFCVQESLALPKQVPTSKRPAFSYLRLRKSGYTTFQGISEAATALAIDRMDVQYAGLKDEDGVTEQLLAVPRESAMSRVAEFNSKFLPRDGRFMELSSYGEGDQPITVGALEGNTFLVVVRSLSEAEANRVRGLNGISFYFLNYYDTQRFGVPDGPKTTHLIGSALAERRYAEALELLRAARTPESDQACAFTGRPADYFEGCDQRQVAFYRSAHASHTWNGQLMALVASTCSDAVDVTESEGIRFAFSPSQASSMEILRRCPSIMCERFRASGSSVEGAVGARDTVIQTRLRCSPVEEDEIFAGTRKVALSFFLSSGSYATMCLRQIEWTMRSMEGSRIGAHATALQHAG